MITEELIKTTFIHQTIKRDVALIYKTQADIVSEVFRGTGKLYNHLSSAPFSLEYGQVTTFHMRLLTYLRFLDIQYRKSAINRKLALYNRVIWGVLYNETLPTLRYGLTQDIRNGIRKQLEEIGDVEKTH